MLFACSFLIEQTPKEIAINSTIVSDDQKIANTQSLSMASYKHALPSPQPLQNSLRIGWGPWVVDHIFVMSLLVLVFRAVGKGGTVAHGPPAMYPLLKLLILFIYDLGNKLLIVHIFLLGVGKEAGDLALAFVSSLVHQFLGVFLFADELARLAA